MSARSTVGIAVILLALALLASPSGADDAKAKPSPEEAAKLFAEASTPGPNHAKLQPLVGSWTYSCKLWMEPGKPAIETKGTIERKWILGGRFLEEKVSGTGLDGKEGGFEAVGLLGYDNSQKKYTSTFACTMCTGSSTAVGVADTSNKFTFQSTCFCPILKKPIEGREEIRIESQDRVVTESYKVIDGKEVKMVELIATRKK